MNISEVKLWVVSDAVDKLIQWTLSTVTRLRRSSNMLLLWIKSYGFNDLNRCLFCLPQEPTMVKRYVNLWKQFLFYILHISLLEESTLDRVYGIHFTENQFMIIRQLLKMLNEYDEDKNEYQSNEEDDNYKDEENDDFYQYEPDEDDENDDKNDNEDMNMINPEDDRINDNDDEYLTRVAEKVMQLSITFITQYFPSGDDLSSPLVHFVDILSISNRFG